MDELIIDVRLNEYTLRDRNPHVPYTPREIARAAADCRDAGASIAHFHARDPATGAASTDAALYCEIAREMRATGDAILLPTLGAGVSDDISVRVGHVEAMGKDPATRAELAPLDLASSNVTLWDAAARRFVGEDYTYRNPVRVLRSLSERVRAAGARPVAVVWNVGSVRLLEPLLEAGILQAPLYVELTLAGSGILDLHPATERGLDALLDFLPRGVDLEWAVLSLGTSLLDLLDPILERGGHLAPGLGDHAYPELGTPSNAALVDACVQRARAHGREPATPDQVRRRLQLPAVPA